MQDFMEKIKQINQKTHQNHCLLAEITIFMVYIYTTQQELLFGDKGEMSTCLRTDNIRMIICL